MDLTTAAQKIRSFYTSHKRIPSYQEMCTLLGVGSKKTAYYLAQKLIEAGILEKDSQGKLIPKNLFTPLPVLGSIRAGYPTDVPNPSLDLMSIENYIVNKPDQSYVLKVSGDSMIEAGIHEGDLVIVERGRLPHNDDIVVAQIDGEFTLKYFRKIEGEVCLVPGNPRYPVLRPTAELTIFGIVVSVIRKYN